MKAYDRAYFDRWYRSRRPVVTSAAVQREARLALATAEFALGREVRSVLDVGCGEGRWRAVLRRMRPKLRYVGVDPSPYVVQRFGRTRGIRAGGLGSIDRIRLRGPFDLIVCTDVLHYLPSPEILAGLPVLARLLRGVLWIRAYTVDDDVTGDREGWHVRRASWYRTVLADAGLREIGFGAWMTPTDAETRLGSLERPAH